MPNQCRCSTSQPPWPSIFFDDLLQQIPEAVTSVEDLTIHLSFPQGNANTGSTRLQRIIDSLKMGFLLEDKFCCGKSQSLIISRSRGRIIRNKAFMQERLLQDHSINILGVTFDFKLNFGQHIANLAHKATQKLNLQRGISFLQVFYNLMSQDRPSLGYSSLAWNGSAKPHLSLLDKTEHMAITLISGIFKHVDDLQRRRDVAGLQVLFKAQHLRPLLGANQTAATTTRTSGKSNAAAPRPPTATTLLFQTFYLQICGIIHTVTMVFHSHVLFRLPNAL